MRYPERGCSVFRATACNDFAFFNDGVYVKHISLDELFENELGRMITPSVASSEVRQHLPYLSLGIALANSESGHFVSRLYDPRAGNMIKISIYCVPVEWRNKFRACDFCSRSNISHRQLVAKTKRM